MTRLLRFIAPILLGLGSFVVGDTARAAFPDRPIRMIVAFAPGGATDVISRIIGQRMGEVLGQQFIVDNHPGAAGTVGTGYLARQPADGYSVMLVNALNHTASAELYTKLDFDPVKSFTSIGEVGYNPYFLIINPKFPAADYAELVKIIRESPGKFNYSSSGMGSSPHLVMELFKKTSGLNIYHVPYKGGGPALNDLVAGVVSLSFENIAAAELIKSGRLRALAVTGEKRSEAHPGVPTFAEVGRADFDVNGYWGLVAPAGVPGDVVAILSKALAEAVNDPSVGKKLQLQGLVPRSGTAQEYGAILQRESDRWRGLLRELNMKK